MRRSIVRLVFLACLACSEPTAVRPPGPEQMSAPEPPPDAALVMLVDPFVGSANDGQTYPGAVTPWGLASPSPHTTVSDALAWLAGAKANAGYLHGEPTLHGFGQTHLSGVGCPDLGGPVIVPTVGDARTRFDAYGSRYENERAYAGYYAVDLIDHGVHAELTATAHVGVQRFFFPDRDGDANILIDVGHTLSWRRPDGRVRVVSETEVEGFVTGGNFCAQESVSTIFFVARFDQPAIEMGTWGGEPEALEARGRVGATLRFRTWRGHPITVAVGLSLTSVEAARANLDREAAGRGFVELRDDAARRWQEELGRVEIEGGSDADRRRFYTALYHVLIHPSVISDAGEEERYSVFSLWDTYRSVHPLLTLLYPERQLGMLRSLRALTRSLGAPPKWELLGNEVNMMVGDPLAVVVAHSVDAGLRGFDEEALYIAMRDAALERGVDAHRPANDDYLDLGYVPMERSLEAWGPVSTTLEYALADAGLSRVAVALGHTDDASALAARASSWEALFDPTTGLIRPLMTDGTPYAPFDPDAEAGSSPGPRTGGPGYVEGTAWAYAFFVPHDIERLVERHGDAATFVSRLDDVFTTDRFSMWNEPDIAYPYLFDYVPGEEARTQRIVRDAMATHFGTGPSGLPGNDDAGTLSAWFVFSALGLYPDDPTRARYALGSPLFSTATLHLEAGDVVIQANGNAADRPFVTARTWNGEDLALPFVEHATVVGGGTLRLEMSATPP
ncbi:MAG: glycoside hydrolase family 92 protein [Sandaracinaceae bacterium]|nr:glycoside hydrolase family 92 protein [Sandaracinaceae bacterium]